MRTVIRWEPVPRKAMHDSRYRVLWTYLDIKADAALKLILTIQSLNELHTVSLCKRTVVYSFFLRLFLRPWKVQASPWHCDACSVAQSTKKHFPITVRLFKAKGSWYNSAFSRIVCCFGCGENGKNSQPATPRREVIQWIAWYNSPSTLHLLIYLTMLY